MGARRLYAAALAIALVAVAGCSADTDDLPPEQTSPTIEPTPSAVKAWVVKAQVRPDWVGRDAPWLWEYSDDVVVIGPRALVALDRESGAEVWRLKVGGRVCGATPVPSEIGLVAVSVGRCHAEMTPTRNGHGGPATARRTVIKGIDLESASVVWERPFIGAPSLDVGGEVLVATAGCGARRLDLTTGETLSRIDAACSDNLLVEQGVVIVSDGDGGNEWRVIDVASGSTRDVTPPGTVIGPRRILTADPLTVLAGDTGDSRLRLVRIDEDGVSALTPVPASADSAFATVTDDRLVLAADGFMGVTVFALEDGAILRHVRYRDADSWIPMAVLDGGLLGFDGDTDGLSSGHARLTTTSLDDNSVTVLGEFGGDAFLGDTNYTVAGPKAVLIDDILLMPGHANDDVVAYRVTLGG